MTVQYGPFAMDSNDETGFGTKVNSGANTSVDITNNQMEFTFDNQTTSGTHQSYYPLNPFNGFPIEK